jgi:hypothetical protein
MNVNNFLEHYGIKNMQRFAYPENLDRIFRVESGTSIRRERIKRARRNKAKDVLEENTDLEPKQIPPDENNNRESLAQDLLGKLGTVRLVDI